MLKLKLKPSFQPRIVYIKFQENLIKNVVVTVPLFFRQNGRFDVIMTVKFPKILRLISKYILIEIKEFFLTLVV